MFYWQRMPSPPRNFSHDTLIDEVRDEIATLMEDNMTTRKTGIISVICLGGGMVVAAAAFAQKNIPDQVKDGEGAYKIGCSLSGTLGIPSCGELPSGRQFNREAPVTPMPTVTPSPSPSPFSVDGSPRSILNEGNEVRQPDSEDSQAVPNVAPEGDDPNQE